MGRVRDFLTGLDDYELAHFVKFKRSTYLQETQEKINIFIADRGITEEKIEELIAQNPESKLLDDHERCPRCYSDKLRRDKVEWTKTAARSGLDDEAATFDGFIDRATYKEQIVCNVCGFWLKDPNLEKKRPWWHGLADFFTDVFAGL